MKKASFTVKKWIVRMLVTVGGVLGFASCHHSGNNSDGGQGGSTGTSESPVIQGSSSASISPEEVSDVKPVECVYGPPEMFGRGEPADIDPVVDVYGPPIIEDPSEPVEVVPE